MTTLKLQFEIELDGPTVYMNTINTLEQAAMALAICELMEQEKNVQNIILGAVLNYAKHKPSTQEFIITYLKK